MATTKQIAANRENAKHSTGPRKDAGKARSAVNSAKHGLLGRFNLVEGEDPREFSKFAAGARAELKPEGEVEELHVRRWIEDAWRLDRIDNILSAALLNQGWSDDPSASDLLHVITYLHDELCREFDKLAENSTSLIEIESNMWDLIENRLDLGSNGESQLARAEQCATLADEWSTLASIYANYLFARLNKATPAAKKAQSTRIPAQTDRDESQRTTQSGEDIIEMMARAFARNRVAVALLLRYRSQFERSRDNGLHEFQRSQDARRDLTLAKDGSGGCQP